jgi:hypothetical protein
MKYLNYQKVRLSDATVYAVLRSGGSIHECVVALANEKEELIKKVMSLELIAPKKLRFPDGSILIYRAPESVIPDPE